MKSVIFAIFMIFGLQASAMDSDVTCGEGGCFSGGWVVASTDGRVLSEVQCTEQSCSTKGWTNIFPRGTTNVTCRSGACFVNGWIETGYDGRLVASAVCKAGNYHGEKNCLKNGWTVYMQNGIDYEVLCLEGGCDQVGWSSTRNGLIEGRSLCKGSGCFIDGWLYSDYQ